MKIICFLGYVNLNEELSGNFYYEKDKCRFHVDSRSNAIAIQKSETGHASKVIFTTGKPRDHFNIQVSELDIKL